MNSEPYTFDRDESLICDLVPSDADILTQELPKFDFTNPPLHPTVIAKHLAETLLSHEALGLSCNQIGMPHRACIMKSDPLICMFNPIIVSHSNEENVLEEGCLSFPDLIIKIKRYDVIRVRYAEPNGNVVTNRYEGMTARVVQHEVDHLNGILFTDRANKIHLERAKKKARKHVSK